MSEHDKPDGGARDPIALWDDVLDGVAEDDAERERLPDPCAIERAAAVLDELRQRAADDPEVLAVIEAKCDGAYSRAETMRRTGLSLLQYRAVLRRLDRLIAELPIQDVPSGEQESHV